MPGMVVGVENVPANVIFAIMGVENVPANVIFAISIAPCIVTADHCCAATYTAYVWCVHC